MITLVEALNYRCLRYVQTPLKRLHVLVGPNASGKSTFLDVIDFLGSLVANGLDAAITERTPNPSDLLFWGKGDNLELAVEVSVPDELRRLTATPELDTVRYQVSIGFDNTQRQFEIKSETLMLKKVSEIELPHRPLFPDSPTVPETLLIKIPRPEHKGIVNKVQGGNDNFYSEIHTPSERRWAPSFRLGPKRSAVGNMIEDPEAFPVATWFRKLLTFGIQRIILNSTVIKKPSPPTKVSGFASDGSNLSWVVARLRRERPDQYNDWIEHLRTALPDLVGIDTVERPEDRHCYMRYEYRGGYKVPSQLVSDGTLRLTALTLPAYLVDLKQGIYLIEEPENGIHPLAISTAYDSLASVYESQVFLATHSPVVLNRSGINNILCFAKDDIGSTDIIHGSVHPNIHGWQHDIDFGTLFASGLLG